MVNRKLSSNSILDVGTFSIVPETTVQAEGLNGTFHCLHPSASAMGWKVNGTSVNKMRPSGVFVGIAGGSRHYLTILASSAYNGTTVQCFAYVGNDEGKLTNDESPSVFLIVQGKNAFLVFMNVSTYHAII